MPEDATPLHQSVQLLTDYLYARRETLLNNWRTRCETDESLQTPASLSRQEFNNQVPVLLNILSQRLLRRDAETDPGERAAQHGLLRWQRGYSFRELLHELNNFYLTLADELEGYLVLYPDTPAQVMALANREVLRLITEVNVGSATYYDELHQTSAAEQVQTLQLALDQLQQVTRRRGERLRETTHDLRGSFGIVSGAASLLQLPVDEEERQQFLTMLGRNLLTAQQLLEKLSDYTRLEAGQEQLAIEAFDAAHLLHDLVNEAQELASERNLVLKAEGPDRLPVVSDPTTVRRLVQNLVTSALKHTASGWVSVSWATEGNQHWLISVQDTGSALRERPITMLAEQLKPLEEPTSIYASGIPRVTTPATHVPEAETTPPASEGIGLFMVKRLCELLKAGMAVETAPEGGTLIRIRLLADQNNVA